MTCAHNTKDYIERKLAGEEVISPGSFYGHMALSEGLDSDTFIVLNIDLERLSFYRYVSKSGRIRIIDYNEDVFHTITRILEEGVWFDEATNKWWNCVFFDCNGQLNYDPSYDTLSISDNCDIHFKAVLEGVSDLLGSLIFQPSKKVQTFILGKLSHSPLIRYILQQMTGSSVKILSKQDTEVSFNENDMADIPEEKLRQITVNSGTLISFYQMTSYPVTMTLPISSLENDFTSNVPWKSLLADNSMDYSVGELGFKMVRLYVECDPFQNVFLSSRDAHGNRKVIQF